MASGIYNRFLGEAWLGNTDLDTDTLKVALLSSGYTFNYDHEVFANVSANQITGTGYAAGGATLSNASVTINDTSDLVYLDGNDVVWTSSTITARYVVVYIDSHATAQPRDRRP